MEIFRHPTKRHRPGARLAGLFVVILLLSRCSRKEVPWTEIHGPSPTAEAAAGSPDILIILIDALRPDHLGCYGYIRATSPFLDRWSAGASKFVRAYTEATHTRMSVASLFTGARPTVHRIRNVDLDADHPDLPGRITDGLSERFTTLAESLAGVGYETWGFSANPHISEELGFTQGFFRWWQTPSRRGADLVDKFEAELAGRRAGMRSHPLLAYLHLMSVHNPYDPPAPWDRTFTPNPGRVVYTNGPAEVSPDDLASTMAQYDAGIRYTDTLLEALVPLWEQTGSRPRAIVVLSDHGEEFLEHGGLGHGMTVFGELAKIALIVKAPGLAVGTVTDPVTTLDLQRMLLDLAGAPIPRESQGRPISAWSAPEPNDPVLYTESRTGWAAYRWKGRALVFSRSAPESAVWFDDTSDPGEKQPHQDADAIGELRGRLGPLLAADEALANELGTPVRVPLGKEMRDALKSLGYLGGN